MSAEVHAVRSRRHRRRAARRWQAAWLAAALCWSAIGMLLWAAASPDPGAAWLTTSELIAAEGELNAMLTRVAASTEVLILSDRHLTALANESLGWQGGPPLADLTASTGEITARVRVPLLAGVTTTLTMHLRLSLLGETVFCAIGPTRLGRVPVPLALWQLAARGRAVPGPSLGWVAYKGTIGFAQAARLADLQGNDRPREIIEVWVREGRVEIQLNEVRPSL